MTAAYGWAFPSGHATSAVLVLGLVAAVSSARLHRRVARVALRVGLLGLAAAIGVSRFWLGVHWMSDVLAGFALGGLWLAGGLVWLHASASRAGSPISTIEDTG
ncbi:MAG: phosphatase PAP2 family protein [Egibacteraceae bacterium]